MPEMKYAKALDKLETIIQQIEDEDIDVDELSAKVKEAVGLVRLCKNKIEKAEMNVNAVVEDFQNDSA